MASGEDTPFFASLIENTPALFAKIMAYNAALCRESEILAHAQTLFTEEQCAQLVPWLCGRPDSMREGVDAIQGLFWNFQEESRKLALLDSALLRDLAAVLGVTVHAGELALLVTREERSQAIEVLGKERFTYALQRGQYLAGSVGALFRDRECDLPIARRCVRHGWLALALCAQEWPREVKDRFCDWLWEEAGESMEPVERLTIPSWRLLWGLIKKCLVREVSPQCADFFA
ncbi:MAG: hypothetical protein IJS54_06095 [Desulfovibrio sp.]|nr:hypothetical protein [Desulfovibrio sp.]